MKDAIGQEINIGDVVAIIYHPEAYSFSVEPATITKVSGTKNKLTTQLIHNEDVTPAFMPDENGDVYRKVVKISPDFPEITDAPLDAVKHAIHLGDNVAIKLPIEAGGNTLKGFIRGGSVTKITGSNIFYEEYETGQIKRKAFNGVIVV